MRSRVGIHTLMLGGALAAAAPAVAQSEIPIQQAAPLSAGEQSLVGITQRVSPAVVGISTRAGTGSGFIVRADGIVLTNAHVVGPYRSVTVELATGEEVQGRVLGSDPGLDVAIVDIPGTGLPVAALGDSDRLQVGQSAIAIGNPLQFSRTVTTGIISGIHRSLPTTRQSGGLDELIQTDAAINPGNSGGPLLNSAGQVIGINTAVVQGLTAQGATAVGLGFAVPINVAREIAEQLLATGSIRRAALGITPLDIEPETARQFNLPVRQGIIVVEVGTDMPAERAGIREGDVITRINDTAINTSGELRRFLRSRRGNETVTVHGIHLSNGSSYTARVQLEEVTISSQR
jgi:S1-C subfamily serine protease